ncbi:MAG: cytochrome c biogenesis protein CcdA [Candidatus Bathyarchaeia archaeon]
MKSIPVTLFTIMCIFILLPIPLTKAAEPVVIEFFYWDPTTHPNMCWTCPSWLSALEDYQNKSKILDKIELFYGSKVQIYRIEYTSSTYDFYVPRNSFVINHEYLLKGAFTENDVKQVIDAYLEKSQLPEQPSPPSLTATLALAFTFGFFETFSPCLIILLAFVLSYTVDEDPRFRKKFSKVMAFAIGFIIATILVFSSLVVGLVLLSLMLNIQYVLMWVVSVFAIIFGLNLLGLNLFGFLKKVDTKPLMRKLTEKYVFTYFGLAALGFLFYFLDPCLAPVFVAMMSTFSYDALLNFLPLILFIFCLGVIIPFIGIGVLAGSISKLARGTYRHKAKIRAVSGSILISYALYLIISYSTSKII